MKSERRTFSVGFEANCGSGTGMTLTFQVTAPIRIKQASMSWSAAYTNVVAGATLAETIFQVKLTKVIGTDTTNGQMTVPTDETLGVQPAGGPTGNGTLIGNDPRWGNILLSAIAKMVAATSALAAANGEQDRHGLDIPVPRGTFIRLHMDTVTLITGGTILDNEMQVILEYERDDPAYGKAIVPVAPKDAP